MTQTIITDAGSVAVVLGVLIPSARKVSTFIRTLIALGEKLTELTAQQTQLSTSHQTLVNRVDQIAHQVSDMITTNQPPTHP